MSGRNSNLKKFNTLASGDMSQSTLTSSVTNINFLHDIGYQFNFTGSPVGDFNVQVSADYEQDNEGNVTNAGSWVSISFSSQPNTTSGSPVYLDIQGISAPWIRATYTKTSGTGTLNVFITGKQR